MFINTLLSQDGKPTVATGQIAVKLSGCSFSCVLRQATLTGGSACEGKVLMCHCGMRTHTLLSHPDAVELKSEVALDKVCAKFFFCFFVYICQCSQNDPVLIYLLFLCCSTLPFTIIVIITPTERCSGAAEHRSLRKHCMSSAEHKDLPRNVKLCVSTKHGSVRTETAQVKKHNCSSFSKWVLN